ncbi:peptidase S49 [Halioglobus japonicus]|uniref:S49 family peptidase n=1 Tax=Halioglobus japonicus TaxID=930805 RepID=A0AAP8MHH9_9GAMM|nr:S49 family peptidase [Halioglobus japonicus]PLW87592.1 S49 family peptidase [Halioglobus japonicus]GHD07648.1 peptidase S49 [Halioglobus japonicus]
MTEESRNSATPGERELMERQISLMENAQKTEASKARWSNILKGSVIFYVAIILVSAAAGYIAAMPPRHDHVAVVEIYGEISEQETSTSLMLPGIREAFENEYVTAIILEIDSPGGSPVHSKDIYDEILRLKALHEKPIVSVIRDIGASGAYYIASATDTIYASEASLVGSIGVTAASFGFTGLMEKVGVERREFVSGDSKAFLDPFSESDAAQVAFWEEVLGDVHQLFIEDVKRGRGERLSSDPKIFTGLIWNGERAKELGLIDDFATVGEVNRDVFESDSLLNYTYEEASLLGDLLGGLGVELGGSALPSGRARLYMKY